MFLILSLCSEVQVSMVWYMHSKSVWLYIIQENHHHWFTFVVQVVLLQVCQGGNRTTLDTVSDPLPTQKSDPNRDQHITLTRPHTVLLLATIRDGLAVRGVFTGKWLTVHKSRKYKCLLCWYLCSKKAPDWWALLQTMINLTDSFWTAHNSLTVTGAMADEFRSADGRRDIYTMFTRAASKVISSSNQQPLFTSTATKTLTLPPVV